MSTVYSDNAHRFASRPEARALMERRSAITDAMHAIREYRDTQHATAVLLASVIKQARWHSPRDTSGPIVLEVPA